MKCTCNATTKEQSAHTSMCDLWANDLFVNGEMTWYPVLGMLLPSGLELEVAKKNNDIVWVNDVPVAASDVEIVETTKKLPTAPECPDCNNDQTISCVQCDSEWFDCDCEPTSNRWFCGFCSHQWTEQIVDLNFAPPCECEPQAEGFCSICDVWFNDENDRWEWITTELHESVQDFTLDEIFDTTPLTCDCKPQKTYFCAVCGVRRDKLDDDWKPSGDFGKTTYTGYSKSYGGKSTGWSNYVGFEKCRHKLNPVTFPDGTTVYASSRTDRKPGDKSTPDFGLYLDFSWRPASMNCFIDWPDYGIPNHFEMAADAIIDFLDRAKRGEVCEVGCIGGHGRTGTALACMAVVSGVPVAEAVAWVRKNHCHEAIESAKQEWWITWFHAYVTGAELPEMPVFTTATTGKYESSCTKSDHHKMWASGKLTCTKQKCQWWDGDVKEFEAGKIPQAAIVVGKTEPTKTAEQLSDVLCPGCKSVLTVGSTACPNKTCAISFTEKFWAEAKNRSAAPKPFLGQRSGEFVYTGDEEGWQLASAIGWQHESKSAKKKREKRETRKRERAARRKQRN